MAPDSQDPRIDTLLRLVSQLTDHAWIANEETNHSSADELDDIIVKLEAFVEKTRRSSSDSRSALDITEHKHAEEALRESERLLRVSQSLARLGSYYFDIESGTWSSSPALDNDVFGIPDDYPKTIEGWIELVHPGDREKMFDHLTDYVLKKRHPFNKEYRIIRHDDQQERWVLGLGELEFDENGTPIKMIGTVQDITERKRAEIGLQESEQKFRAVVQNAHAIIFILDRDGVFMLSEGRDLEKIGLVPNQVAGMSALELYRDNPSVIEGIKKALAGELVHIMTDVQGVIFDVVYSPFYNLENKLTGVVGIAIDITEHKQSERELQKQKRFIDAILENAPIGFAINTIDGGQIKFVSEKFCEIYGHPLETIDTIDSFFENVYPDPVFREQIRERIMADIASGDPMRMRWENIPTTTDTGERRVITATNIPLLEQNLMISTVQDVTDQANTEEKLRLNGFALERLTDAVYWVDQDTRIVDVNKAACRLLGYSREELVGMTLENINPTFDYSDKNAIWETLKGGPLPPLETQHKTKDGTLVSVEVLANYIEFEGKQLSCTFVRDITERKQTGEALRQSEARYRALVESQVDLFSRYLPDTTLTYVNDAYCQFYGKTRDELIGQSYLTIVAPEFRELAHEETKNLVKEPRLISGEYLNFAADGKACWIHWIIQPILDEQGQVVEFQAVGRDVSQLKQTESALRESEFFLQKSQEVAQIGSFYVDAKTGHWICSPMLDKIYGIDDSFTKDIEGWVSLIHPADREELEQHLRQDILTEHKRFDKEFRIRRHDDQQEVWVHGLGEPEFDADGTLIAIIGTTQDITEHKRMEETLHESENRFSVIFNQSADLQVLSSVEPDGTIRFMAFNNRYLESVARDYGISAQDIVGKTIPEVANDVFGFDESVADYTLNYYNQVIETGQVVRYEETLQTPVGPFYSETVIAPIFGALNECRYILYSARDIGGRKQAEAALRESEFFLQKSQEVAQIGSYYFDIETATWICSPMLDELLGIDDQFSKDVDGWLGLVHPDHREEMREHLYEHVLQNHNRFEKEYQIIRHDDHQKRWVYGLGELEFDDQNNPVKMIGTIQDITEKKQVAETLRESENRFSVIFNESADLQAISTVEADGTFRFAALNNHYLERIQQTFGVSEQDVVGKTVREVISGIFGFDESVSDYTLNYYNQVVESKEVVRYEETLQTPIGPFYAESVIAPIFGSSNECRYILYSARDINERKRAEVALREREAQTRALLNAIPDTMFGFDQNGIFVDFKPAEQFQLLTQPEQFMGKNIKEILPPDVAEETLQGFKKAKETGIVQTFEYSMPLPDGLHHYEARCFVFDAHRDYVLVRDISKRKQQEEALRLNSFALERTSDAVYWLRRSQIIDVNEAACHMLGYSREELRSMSMANIDPIMSQVDMFEAWERLKKEGATIIESQHRTKDGRIIPVEVMANYIAFEGKEFNCCFVRDITARKEAERSLRLNSFALERTADSVYWIDSERRVVDVNEAACQMLGYTREELIGMSVEDIDPSVDTADWPGIRAIMRAGRSSIETQHKTKDGRIIPVEIMANFIVFEGKDLNCCFARDITERKRAEEALRLNNFALESTSDAVYWLNSEGRVVDVNEASCRMLGYSREEFRGMPLETLDPTFDRTTWDHSWERVKIGVPPLETQHRTKDGRIIPVEVMANYIAFEGKELNCCFVRDITERKQAEKTLLLTSFAIETVSDAVYWVDSGTTITDVNEAACRTMGYSREEFVGMSISAIDPTLTSDSIKALWKQTKENGTLKFETHHQTKDGRVFPVEIVSSYVAYEDSEFSCCFVRDITERKQAEEAIRKLNEELEQRVVARTRELEQANDEIRHFAYIVSHDLRAPLVNLKGFAAELRTDLKVVEESINDVLPLVDSAKRGSLTQIMREDIPESLRFIESSVGNMDSFTKAILKLSRLGRLHLDLGEVDVKSLVEKILESLSYQITQKGTQVTLGDLPVITADLVSMEQIFGNLLTNAVTYLDPNRPGEIVISAEQHANATYFSIQDNGRGIAQEDFDKVFAPFRRAGQQNMPGEGMGLAYVQTLIRRHSGRIWFESEAGVGTTFTFTIPKNLRYVTLGI